MEKSRVLVVGSTGYIGRRLVRASLAQGHPTLVLLRPEIGLDIDKLQMLLSFKAQGARVVEASLEDHAGLLAAVGTFLIDPPHAPRFSTPPPRQLSPTVVAAYRPALGRPYSRSPQPGRPQRLRGFAPLPARGPPTDLRRPSTPVRPSTRRLTFACGRCLAARTASGCNLASDCQTPPLHPVSSAIVPNHPVPPPQQQVSVSHPFPTVLCTLWVPVLALFDLM
jgi:hypothetical protein